MTKMRDSLPRCVTGFLGLQSIESPNSPRANWQTSVMSWEGLFLAALNEERYVNASFVSCKAKSAGPPLNKDEYPSSKSRYH